MDTTYLWHTHLTHSIICFEDILLVVRCGQIHITLHPPGENYFLPKNAKQHRSVQTISSVHFYRDIVHFVESKEIVTLRHSEFIFQPTSLYRQCLCLEMPSDRNVRWDGSDIFMITTLHDLSMTSIKYVPVFLSIFLKVHIWLRICLGNRNSSCAIRRNLLPFHAIDVVSSTSKKCLRCHLTSLG